jgi:chemotaxis protein MotB
MKKKKAAEEHESLDRWLLTYSDLITLLLGLFVILYSCSKVDQKQFEQISAQLSKIFGAGESVLPGTPMVAPSLLPLPAKESILDSLQREITKGLVDLPEQEGITFEQNQFGLVMHFKDRLLFEVGKADLRPDSYNILTAVALSLKSIPNEILIEGHTDSIPINTPQFPSNMHLSSSRAMNTMLFLTERGGLSRDKLSVRAYGEYKPIAFNDCDTNRAKNRRVDIVIVNEKEKDKFK